MICLKGDQPCDTSFCGVNVFEFTGPAGLCALFTLVRRPSPSCLKAWDVGSFGGCMCGFTTHDLPNQCSGTSKQKSGNQGECPWPGSRVLARVTTGRWSYCAPGVLMLSCKAKSCPAVANGPGTLSSPFPGLDLWMLCIRFFPSMAWRLGTPGVYLAGFGGQFTYSLPD